MKTSSNSVHKYSFFTLFLLSFLIQLTIYAQQEYPVPGLSGLEDDMMILRFDKPVYFPGEFVNIKVRSNSGHTVSDLQPILVMDNAVTEQINDSSFRVLVPPTCIPGLYPVRIRYKDNQGRRLVHETGFAVKIEEHHLIEDLNRFVCIVPFDGGSDPESIVTLDREKLRDLRVFFLRDNIRPGMGPQFLTIRTTIQLRDGTKEQSTERRVLTFRSDEDSNHDQTLMMQYRNAYGPYSALKTEELQQVRLNFDSLPDWAIVQITVEPDYSIKIGEVDHKNSVTRYYHVKGPAIEVGLVLGIPKVLYDSQMEDRVDYGNSSAMIRFYYVNERTGNRFPVNFGVGTFGVNSPLDVDIGRGGFALSLFFDLAQITSFLSVDFMKRITAGIEVAPFFPIQKKWRLLIIAQLGFSI
ncbi:MAG: hypothetical protein J0L60_13265 [Ignavibacteria bacterium]|nr:hypothetical protein [Ignavibacteria bacterium]